MGVEPRLTIGSTNSNIPISLGVPAVTIGRGGDGGKAHSLDEWWINKDGYKIDEKLHEEVKKNKLKNPQLRSAQQRAEG